MFFELLDVISSRYLAALSALPCCSTSVAAITVLFSLHPVSSALSIMLIAFGNSAGFLRAIIFVAFAYMLFPRLSTIITIRAEIMAISFASFEDSMKNTNAAVNTPTARHSAILYFLITHL